MASSSRRWLWCRDPNSIKFGSNLSSSNDGMEPCIEDMKGSIDVKFTHCIRSMYKEINKRVPNMMNKSWRS